MDLLDRAAVGALAILMTRALPAKVPVLAPATSG
jgi:hypothetical protein